MVATMSETPLARAAGSLAPRPMNGVVAAGAIALAGLSFGGARLLRRSRVTA